MRQSTMQVLRSHLFLPSSTASSPEINALMAHCDRLEASLIATAAIRLRLIDALLAEAVATTDVLEIEAAE